jgi:hypothetical protein
MFDPYYKWLGIPPKDQPPHIYRLLALEPFESDIEVIDAAANRQMAYVHQRATGEHAAWSQKLLNELSVARLCLLDPQKKAAYDARLRAALHPANGNGADAVHASHSLGGLSDLALHRKKTVAVGRTVDASPQQVEQRFAEDRE